MYFADSLVQTKMSRTPGLMIAQVPPRSNPPIQTELQVRALFRSIWITLIYFVQTNTREVVTGRMLALRKTKDRIKWGLRCVVRRDSACSRRFRIGTEHVLVIFC